MPQAPLRPRWPTVRYGKAERQRQEARQRAEAEAQRLREATWRAEAAAAHRLAVEREVVRGITASARRTGCRPAWVIAAQAVDEARVLAADKRGLPAPSALVATALGEADGPPLSYAEAFGRTWPRPCRSCSMPTPDTYCWACAADAEDLG